MTYHLDAYAINISRSSWRFALAVRGWRLYIASLDGGRGFLRRRFVIARRPSYSRSRESSSWPRAPLGLDMRYRCCANSAASSFSSRQSGYRSSHDAGFSRSNIANTDTGARNHYACARGARNLRLLTRYLIVFTAAGQYFYYLAIASMLAAGAAASTMRLSGISARPAAAASSMFAAI